MFLVIIIIDSPEDFLFEETLQRVLNLYNKDASRHWQGNSNMINYKRLMLTTKGSLREIKGGFEFQQMTL